MPGHNGTHKDDAFDRFVCPVDLRLPDACRWRTAKPDDECLREDLSRCCRHDHSLQYSNEEPLCLAVGREDESYRFSWRQSFGAGAIVRIGWSASRTVLRSRYQEGLFARPPEGLPREKTLSDAQRKMFIGAIAAAEFWTRDTVDRVMGLDGAEWLIEGRRGDKYRRWELWSPAGEIGQLGYTFFELAGLPPTEL